MGHPTPLRIPKVWVARLYTGSSDRPHPHALNENSNESRGISVTSAPMKKTCECARHPEQRLLLRSRVSLWLSSDLDCR